MTDPEFLMFEIHHDSRFDREHRCTYIGGDVANYPNPIFDKDKMSFIEVNGVVEFYGYGSGNLIYYNIPNKRLDKGLILLSSDHDVLEMVEHHIGHGLVELYLVSFGRVDINVDVHG